MLIMYALNVYYRIYILITNATTKHTLRRQTINQCPWASRDR